MKKSIIISVLFLCSLFSYGQNDRNSPIFENFLTYFMNTCFWDNNIDSLTYYSSTKVTQFYHKDFEFSRFYNIGSVNGRFNKTNNYNLNDYVIKDHNYPNLELNIIKDSEPKYNDDEELITKDGIYYKVTTNLPEYLISDGETEKISNTEIPIQFKNSNIIIVQIQYQEFIIKKMYFIKYNKIYYLIFFDDSDSST